MILPCGCCDHASAWTHAPWFESEVTWCRDCGALWAWHEAAVAMWHGEARYAHPIPFVRPRASVPCMHEARYRGLIDVAGAELDATQRAILAAMSPEGQAVLLRVLRLLRRTRSQRPNRPT